MKIHQTITWIAAFLAAGLSASGTSLLQENFDGLTAGGLNGQGGWTAAAGVNVTAGGLSYSNGTIAVAGGTHHVQNSVLSDGLTPVAQAAFATQSNEVWFSYTFQVNSLSSGDTDRFWFFISDDPSINVGATVAFCDDNNGSKALKGSFRRNTSSTATDNVGFSTGTTYFVVGRMSKDGASDAGDAYDLAEFWVNPDSSTLGTSTLTVDVASSVTEGIDTFGLTVLSAASDMLWDNLRIGTAKDVVLDVYVSGEGLNLPPAAPAGLAATAGDGLVSLNWDDNTEADLDSYSVYRSTLSGSYSSALATNVVSSDYVDNSVLNGTVYYYVVTATDTNDNESAQSAEVSAAPTDPPVDSVSPIDVTLSSHGGGQDVIRWAAQTGAVYSVYYSTNLLDGFQPLETNLPETATSLTNFIIAPSVFYRCFSLLYEQLPDGFASEFLPHPQNLWVDSGSGRSPIV